MTKVDVISGFLGAGKTTLIQKLIKEVFAGKKVVLVENEFGEIGIDGGFLQEAGIEITEINSGCICCTLKGDFEEALKQVAAQYQPDHIIIEPSGVGKLSDILRAIRDVEGMELNSYSTVVDAKRCAVYHKNFKEFFDDQIETAACVILSRTQMTSEEALAKDEEIIRSLNENARLITTPWDELSGQAILEAMEGSSSGFPELPEDDDDDDDDEHEHHHHHDHDEDDDEHEHHHHHDHDEDDDEHEHHHHDHDEDDDEHEHHHHHDHDEDDDEPHDKIHLGDEHHHHHHHHHHHGDHDADEVFDSIGIETINKYSAAELNEILAQLGDNIVRAKGIVPTEDGSWLFFDYVPGDVDIREGKAAYTGLITVIGEKIDLDEIKRLFRIRVK